MTPVAEAAVRAALALRRPLTRGVPLRGRRPHGAPENPGAENLGRPRRAGGSGRGRTVGSWMPTGRSCCCCTGPTSTCSATASRRSTARRRSPTTSPPRSAAAGAHGLTVEAFQSNHEGELVDAIHGARRPLRGDHHQPRRLHALRLEHPRRAGRLRRAGRRAAPLQPQRPRAVAPHQRDRAGRHRVHRRLRRRSATSWPPDAVAKLLGSGREPVELTPIGYATRPDAVRAAARRRDARRLDAVEHPLADRRSAGSLGWVVVGPERVALITDGRYAERAAADLAAAGLDASASTSSSAPTRAEVRDHVVALAGRGPVLAEADHLTHAAVDRPGRATSTCSADAATIDEAAARQGRRRAGTA